MADMIKTKLINLALASSGDKGNMCNVGVCARSKEIYQWMVEYLTEEMVKERFKDLAKGKIIRYELPNLLSLNFCLYECLDGGGTVSLRADTQGKSYWAWMLKMEVEVPRDLLDTIPDTYDYLNKQYD